MNGPSHSSQYAKHCCRIALMFSAIHKLFHQVENIQTKQKSVKILAKYWHCAVCHENTSVSHTVQCFFIKMNTLVYFDSTAVNTNQSTKSVADDDP